MVILVDSLSEAGVFTNSRDEESPDFSFRYGGDFRRSTTFDEFSEVLVTLMTELDLQTPEDLAITLCLDQEGGISSDQLSLLMTGEA